MSLFHVVWVVVIFFNTRLVNEKGIKHFENAAKEMETNWGRRECLLLSTENKEDFVSFLFR